VLKVFIKIYWYNVCSLNTLMNFEQLINQGNDYRAQRQPEQALSCYAQVFLGAPNHAAAWNNYGNVLREMGYPDRSIPFLEHCLRLDPDHEQANFNLAVSLLLMGDYQRGWKQYEQRWNFEHLRGMLPSFAQPRWQGESLKDKKLLIVGEQGLGDCIQFVRFCKEVKTQGGHAIMVVPDPLIALFQTNTDDTAVVGYEQTLPDFDFWIPMMSMPGILGVTIENLNSPISYISAKKEIAQSWQQRLGPKTRMRVGFSWSGRRDTWINQHKSVPFSQVLEMIKNNPQYDWINLQVDAADHESQALADTGVSLYPGTIQSMDDTAGLISCLDVVISVDTAVSHLAAAMGRPTWIMLNHYGLDWRWLLARGDSPWYPTARLFRQPSMDQWQPVLDRIQKFLKVFTI
jgi:hypothetical protein